MQLTIDWQFTYNATGTPYEMVRKFMFGVGKAAPDHTGKLVLVANTIGQRHPTTGALIWLHRLHAKFSEPGHLFDYDPVPRAWTHMGKQGVKSRWDMVTGSNRHLYPSSTMLPKQVVGMVPTGRDVKMREVEKDVGAI